MYDPPTFHADVNDPYPEGEYPGTYPGMYLHDANLLPYIMFLERSEWEHWNPSCHRCGSPRVVNEVTSGFDPHSYDSCRTCGFKDFGPHMRMHDDPEIPAVPRIIIQAYTI